jgi:hypothetical protein
VCVSLSVYALRDELCTANTSVMSRGPRGCLRNTSLSQYALLGNDWMAFTQIFSVAGKDPFERTLAKDSEIVGSLRATGVDKMKVGIDWSDQSGKVELISRQACQRRKFDEAKKV